MTISPDVEARAMRLFSGFKKSADLTIQEFHEAQTQHSLNTIWRLLTGHPGTRWDISTLEAFASIVAARQQLPVADIMHYLFGRESEHAETYREFDLASHYIMRPKVMARIGKRLETYDESAKLIVSAQRFLPVSQMVERLAGMYNSWLTVPLGKIGRRMFSQLQTFSRIRRERFLDCGSNFGNAIIRSYHFVSDFNLMRDRKQCFANLSDEVFDACIESLMFDCVQERRVQHLLVNDTRMPLDLLNYFAPHNGVMVIDDRFTMKWYRNRLSRSICERSIYTPQCNEHINHTRAQLKRLDGYLMHGDSAADIIQSLEGYRL